MNRRGILAALGLLPFVGMAKSAEVQEGDFFDFNKLILDYARQEDDEYGSVFRRALQIDDVIRREENVSNAFTNSAYANYRGDLKIKSCLVAYTRSGYLHDYWSGNSSDHVKFIRNQDFNLTYRYSIIPAGKWTCNQYNGMGDWICTFDHTGIVPCVEEYVDA